jgi:demethylmenaquinone methyltransferase/2-methoxy-6-polyprenyl-1,4-benzoquinol methylase
VRSALPAAADKPRYVAAMFSRIAGRYDLMNTLMTAGLDGRWRRAVAAVALRSQPEARVLDVGTGTGKLAQAVARHDQQAHVIGVDFAEPMLRLARRRVAVAAADGLRLPFADAQFDAVVSAFVVRNLADVRAGLREQARVLRPGGRLVVLETTPGPPGLLRPLFRLVFRRLVPALGGLIAGDARAYTYLPESTAAFLEPERLAEELRAAGLSEVRVRRLGLGSVAVTQGRVPSMLRRAGERS